MKSLGTHLIADAWECPVDYLNDGDRIREALHQTIRLSGSTLIDLCVHRFSPQGVTATATLAESHIAIHTWPEYRYLAADLFFCGTGNPALALRTLLEHMGAGRSRIRELRRGFEGIDATRRPIADIQDALAEKA